MRAIPAICIFLFFGGTEVWAGKDIIRDDFLINDDQRGGTEQIHPDVGIDGAGNFVITWMDSRNGGEDIYAQRYDSNGAAVDSNFCVNDDDIANIQHLPCVAMNSSGRCLLEWTDFRDWIPGVYGQLYNSSGQEEGVNFRLSDSLGFQLWTVAGMAESGNFVVVWGAITDETETFSLYGQKFDPSGTPTTNTFCINDSGPVITWENVTMDMAMNKSGQFIVVWDAVENWDIDVYGQIYSANCVRQGDNFRANTSRFRSQAWANCGMDDAGNSVVVWADSLSGIWEIFGQKYDAAGSPNGANFRINDAAVTHLFPSVSMNGSGDFVVVWTDFRAWMLDVYGQKYTPSGPQGGNFKLNDYSEEFRLFPDVAMNDNGDFVGTWIDERLGNNDIYAQRFNSACMPIGENFCTNTDPPTNDQWDPCISTNTHGSSVVVWEDMRGGRPDVYVQRFDSSGLLQSPNIKAHWTWGHEYSPSAAISKYNRFVVTWVDENGQDGEEGLLPPIIMARTFNQYGAPESDLIEVNEDTTGTLKGNPCVAVDNSCNFVVVWEDKKNGDFDVYGQTFSVQGSPTGSNFRINDDVGVATQWHPSVGMNGFGSFAVVWEDMRGGKRNICGQRYNAAGAPQDGNFTVNTDTVAIPCFPVISMNGSGNFVAVWIARRDSVSDIYGQRYNSSGEAQGGNFKVNTTTDRDLWYPSVAVRPDGKFIAVWTDFENPDNPKIVAQRYEANGMLYGVNVVMNGTAVSSKRTGKRSVGVGSGVVAFAWMDDRRDMEWDIYAKVTDWELIGVEETNCQLAIGNEQLSIHPNPFIHNTVVEFVVQCVETPYMVSLRIHDLSGRLVRTFDLTNHQSPFNQITWDGRDNSGKRVGAGVFFVKLNAGDKKLTEKVIVVR